MAIHRISVYSIKRIFITIVYKSLINTLSVEMKAQDTIIATTSQFSSMASPSSISNSSDAA